jgi:N6-L-threonylcarbamoyladenine synthase
VKILAIETSCDETAASVVDCQGELSHLKAEVISHVVHSQAALHAEYGGVFPSLAKREHAKNMAAVVADAVKPVASEGAPVEVDEGVEAYFRETLSREGNLADSLLDLVRQTPKPAIDLVSVTQGPGLEPALWVGISAAKCLARAWGVPVVGADHMLGHIAAAQIGRETPVPFPALACLASGGHTEIAWAQGWDKLEVIGETRDDAIGEAYDKVARVLGLPYPGGPEVSKLAAAERANPSGYFSDLKLPRPMMNSGDLDFSLSGLKTAVLYAMRDQARLGGGAVSEEFRAAIAREFEEAVTDVLAAKVGMACEERDPKSVIAGGGVFANAYIRGRLADVARECAAEPIFTPAELATDNATMVALSGYIRFLSHGPDSPDAIRANGSQRLGTC